MSLMMILGSVTYPSTLSFFPCPAVILDKDLQMGKLDLPCPQPWENRMLTELLIHDSARVCVPTEGSTWRHSRRRRLGISLDSFISLQRLMSGC